MKTQLLGSAAAAVLVIGVASAQPIEEVLITGNLLEEELPQELARYGVRVETITAQELVNGGYYDITQALQQTVPGLYIAARGGPFDYVDLSLQGSRTSEVLWLVDGVRINNRLYAGTTPVDTIPAHVVERIEVLEGGQGLFYGTQAVAGAVNVVTKAFSETPDGAISVAADTNEGRHINGYFRDAIDGHHVVIYGSSDQAEGFQPFRDSDFQPSATDRKRGYDVMTIGGKYAYNFSDALRFSVNYQHTDAKLDHAQPKFIAEAFNERDEDILSGKLDYRASENFELFLKGYYHWWDATYTELDNTSPPSGTLEVIDDRTPWWFHDYGLNALGRFGTGRGFDIFAGYDFQNFVGQDDVLLIAKRTEQVHAPFAQIRTTPELFGNARFAFGIRHNMPSTGEEATVWNASGQWDIMANLFLRGTVGTAFRLPTAEELFAIDPFSTLGNQNLEPEKSFNINGSIGGVANILGGASWEIIGFYRDVDNLIAADAATDVYVNVPGTVEVRGVQFVAHVALNDILSANGSFTYSSSEASGAGEQINDVPETLVKFGLDFHPMNMPLGATLTVNHVGDIFRNLGVGRQKFGNYTTVDLAGRVYLDQNRKHRIVAKLENVFDERYATRVRQTTPDGGGAPYVYWHLGVPQTFHLSYAYDF